METPTRWERRAPWLIAAGLLSTLALAVVLFLVTGTFDGEDDKGGGDTTGQVVDR